MTSLVCVTSIKLIFTFLFSRNPYHKLFGFCAIYVWLTPKFALIFDFLQLVEVVWFFTKEEILRKTKFLHIFFQVFKMTVITEKQRRSTVAVYHSWVFFYPWSGVWFLFFVCCFAVCFSICLFQFLLISQIVHSADVPKGT